MRGTFGDMFGAVNALFSGLAFAGMIITLLQQKEELSLQRKELEETRKELEGQKEQQKKQNETLSYQRFETTFFNLLSAFQKLRDGLIYRTSELSRDEVKEYKGISVFDFFYNQKKNDTNLCVDPYGGKGILEYKATLFREIPDISVLDHYYRSMYRVVKYVDESPLIRYQDRYDYICILRALLSEYELVMLFYNCLGSKGCDKFKTLVEKYALLKNLDTQLLAKSEHNVLYKGSAYHHTDFPWYHEETPKAQ